MISKYSLSTHGYWLIRFNFISLINGKDIEKAERLKSHFPDLVYTLLILCFKLHYQILRGRNGFSIYNVTKDNVFWELA